MQTIANFLRLSGAHNFDGVFQVQHVEVILYFFTCEVPSLEFTVFHIVGLTTTFLNLWIKANHNRLSAITTKGPKAAMTSKREVVTDWWEVWARQPDLTKLVLSQTGSGKNNGSMTAYLINTVSLEWKQRFLRWSWKLKWHNRNTLYIAGSWWRWFAHQQSCPHYLQHITYTLVQESSFLNFS